MINMKWTLMAFLLVSPPAFAQRAAKRQDDTTLKNLPVMNTVVAATAEQLSAPLCPNPEKLDNICLNVSNRTKASKPMRVPYSYRYQEKILDAACADLEKDSEEAVAQKIRVMWDKSWDKLKCNSVQFDVPAGNILKFAVSTKFTEFIDDAIYWEVDLNEVDHLDQRTVLDYLTDQIEKNKGLSIEVTLRHYYKILREAGAKHKSEL